MGYIGIDVRALVTSLCSVVWTCAVLAQPVTPEKRSVSGVVVDSATGASIPQAIVVLEGGPSQPRSLTTDGAGRFRFEEAAAPEAALRIGKQGYQSDSQDRWARVILARTSSWQDLTVKLTPLCAIQGRVVSADDYPIPGLEVQALRVRIVSGRRQVSVHARNYTNDLGEYRLWHLQPGSYYLRVAPRGATALLAATPPGVAQPGETYGPLYYPSSLERAAAELLRLAPGTESRADFVLAPGKAFGIRGTVSNLPSYSRASIRLFRGEEEVSCRAALDVATGTFQVMDVPPGSYVLQATASEPDPRTVGEVLVTVDDRNVTGVTVPLTEGVEVRGTVGPLGGTPAGRPPAVSVQATRLDPERAPASLRSVSAGVGADGAFVLKNVLPGKYVIRVYGGIDYQASAIQSGSIDVLSEGLTVGLSSPAALKIELSKSAARLEISVSGLRPGTSASVAVVRGDQPAAEPPVYRTDAQGEYIVRGLLPGAYSIYAWSGPDEFEYNNPAVLAALSAHAVTVHLSPGASERITVGLLPGEDSR